MSTATTGVDLSAKSEQAQKHLDAHVRQIIEWHLTPLPAAHSGWNLPPS